MNKTKQKLITAVTLTSLIGGALFPVISHANTRYYGDIDGNGKPEASDARTALRASVGLDVLTSQQEKIADMDSDGKVSSADARIILRTSVGLEELRLFESALPDRPDGSDYVYDKNGEPDPVYFVDGNGNLIDSDGRIYGDADDFVDKDGTLTDIPKQPISDANGNIYCTDKDGIIIDGFYISDGKIIDDSGNVYGSSDDYTEIRKNDHGQLIGVVGYIGDFAMEVMLLPNILPPSEEPFDGKCEVCGRTDCSQTVNGYHCKVCNEDIPAFTCHPTSHFAASN